MMHTKNVAMLLAVAVLIAGCTINRFEVNMARNYTVQDSNFQNAAISPDIVKGEESTSIPNVNAQAVDTEQVTKLLNNILKLAAELGIKLM